MVRHDISAIDISLCDFLSVPPKLAETWVSLADSMYIDKVD